jgi:hypothetical protein
VTNGQPIIIHASDPDALFGATLPMQARPVTYEKWSRPRWLRVVRTWLGVFNPHPKILSRGVAPGQTVAITSSAQTMGKKLRVRRLVVSRICVGWTVNKLIVDGRHVLSTPFTATAEANRTGVSGIGDTFTMFATNTTDRTQDFLAFLLGDLVDLDDAEVWA